MNKYTFEKKAAAVVFHQMFLVLMITSLFHMNFSARQQMKGNSMIFSMLSVIGLVGSFIELAYLTNTAGADSEDDASVHLIWIDKIYGDVLTLIFVLFIYLFGRMSLRLHKLDFTMAGLLISAGTITYAMDGIFLLFYLSMVRRLKSNTFFSQSGVYCFINWMKAIIAHKRHGKKGGLTRRSREKSQIQDALEAIAAGEIDTKLDVEQFHGKQRSMAEIVNHIGAGMTQAVTESIRNERMKADLITNVSHDIKTPLTSIVNYVGLLNRENLDNENARRYIRILDEKSQRLKQLTEDLVEVSKISYGNIQLEIQKIDLVELLYQAGGEFNERFEDRNLTIVTKLPHEPVIIMADGRQLSRIIENLYSNAAKYALEKTRVYVELTVEEESAVFSIKNIAKNQINHFLQDGGNELTERFVRGEESRTTEGSGLGLSIAKSLTVLMNGEFSIHADGDLFVTTISFKMA